MPAEQPLAPGYGHSNHGTQPTNFCKLIGKSLLSVYTQRKLAFLNRRIGLTLQILLHVLRGSDSELCSSLPLLLAPSPLQTPFSILLSSSPYLSSNTYHSAPPLCLTSYSILSLPSLVFQLLYLFGFSLPFPAPNSWKMNSVEIASGITM